jgi:peroxiredoxin (alkyl hydroperoxide reductase subunit C)
MKLSDLKGKLVVLFSHPADFTPVCTTEFMAFTDICENLKSLNVNLTGRW